jgi:hypothetical protein
MIESLDLPVPDGIEPITEFPTAEGLHCSLRRIVAGRYEYLASWQ